MEEREESLLTCDPTKVDCRDCVWAFVYGLKPTSCACGKYAKKPANIYFNNAKCSLKKPFEGKKDI